MSAPAENARPSAAKTTARDASTSVDRSASCTARSVAVEMAFSFCGRRSVTMATAPSRRTPVGCSFSSTPLGPFTAGASYSASDAAVDSPMTPGVAFVFHPVTGPMEGGTMGELRSASFDTPGETRAFDKGRADLVTLGDATIGRFTFQPGWRWSESLKPVVGTDSCQNHHMGVAVSGRMHVEMADGSSAEVGPGEASNAPGHDAWVVGDEAFTGFE